MKEAPYGEGEFVFQQGDAGLNFYVILSGVVSCLREDIEKGTETVLAVLGEGAFFGERALLQSEQRYASVRADSQLLTMCISRDMFENVLGPLGIADLVVDAGPSSRVSVYTHESH